MSSKFRLWELYDRYSRVLYADADAFYAADPRSLFSVPGDLVAEKSLRAAVNDDAVQGNLVRSDDQGEREGGERLFLEGKQIN